VLGDGGTKGAAADDDHVERATALASPCLCLEEIVAEIATLDVFGKRSELAGFRHCFPPRSVRDESSHQVAQDLLRVFRTRREHTAMDGKQIRKYYNCSAASKKNRVIDLC
jgi:hypothetical protein